MTYFPWSNDCSVGIRIIDNDHKDLFGMVNALHVALEGGAPAKNIDSLLAALSRYVEEHFEREEELMAAYNYPGLSAHKAKHKELALDVHALRKAHISHPHRVDRDKFLEYLKNWLSNHILRSDMDYVPYLRDQADKKQTKERRRGRSGGKARTISWRKFSAITRMSMLS
jgi:hemerythrin